jgi:GNAT superfamily N-acetyltransferase
MKELKNNIKIVSFKGESIKDLIPEVAKLRIEVFAEYPFLYQGSEEYEKRYLNKFLIMKEAIVVVAFHDNSIIGISTGYPLIYDLETLQQVLISAHRDPKDYFCFGESILKKSYRGLGIGNVFFDEREAHVQTLGNYSYLCFYTILRPEDDPRRPPDYHSLVPFWEKRGFVKHPELIGEIPYQEIGEAEETPKQLIFWIKHI